MAIDLSKPPAWLAASHEEQQMLRDLQGNIPKGHGRPETTNIFFKLAPTRAQASRRALREIVKKAKDAGIARWDPQFGLGAALVAEPPATPGAINFGSDFILRKLELDVCGFKRREQLLTGEEEREIAGALVVGRCEDGTPATMSDGRAVRTRRTLSTTRATVAAVARSRRPSARSTRETRAPSGPPSAGTSCPGAASRSEDIARPLHLSDLPGSESVAASAALHGRRCRAWPVLRPLS